MQQNLRPYLRAILSVLDDDAGYTTGEVSRRIIPIEGMFGINMRQHSGATRAWLVEMQKIGLVGLLDGLKPDCWKRTEAGRAALSAAGQGHNEGGG